MMSNDDRQVARNSNLNGVEGKTDIGDNILAYGYSALPFLEAKTEFIALFGGAFCVFLVFLGLSTLSEQITAFSSILFGFFFVIISCMNIIIGRSYRQSIEYASQVLEEEK